MSEFEKLFGAVTPLLLAGMIAGLVELAKRFGLKGNACILLSMGLGVVFAELLMLVDLYPEALSLPVRMGVYGLLFGLFVSGLYSLGQRAGLLKPKNSGIEHG